MQLHLVKKYFNTPTYDRITKDKRAKFGDMSSAVHLSSAPWQASQSSELSTSYFTHIRFLLTASSTKLKVTQLNNIPIMFWKRKYNQETRFSSQCSPEWWFTRHSFSRQSWHRVYEDFIFDLKKHFTRFNKMYFF